MAAPRENASRMSTVPDEAMRARLRVGSGAALVAMAKKQKKAGGEDRVAEEQKSLMSQKDRYRKRCQKNARTSLRNLVRARML